MHRIKQPVSGLAARTLRHTLPFTALLWAVTILTREPDQGDLRLGQRVYVDDGTCPAGQIKEVAGANMTSSGIVRSRQCVPRNSIRR
jgi:hypothetical protein